MKQKYIDSLFADPLPPAPMSGQGLGKSEKLWFNRLSVARRLALTSKKNKTLWVDRHEHCRAFIAGSNTGLALRLVGIFSKASAANARRGDDINSAAFLALLRAIDKFKVGRGFKFSTYAYSAMKKEISRTLMKESKNGNHFVDETTYFGTSMSKPLGDSNVSQGLDWRPAPESDTIATRDNLEALERAMLVAGLTNVEKIVIDQRFRQNLTLEDVGKIIGVTKERVRQIQNKALAKLRVAMEEGSKAA